MLGPWRVLDSMVALGVPLPVGPAEVPDQRLVRFALPEPGPTLHRYLGSDLDRSPVHPVWATATLR